MKKYYITGLLLFSLGNTFAQVDPVGNFNRHIAANWSGQYVRIGQYHVKGSLYFLGESFPGTMTYKGGKTIADGKILYDLYNQKAGLQVGEGIFEANEPVDSFSISLPAKFGGEKLYFKNCVSFGDEKLKGYFNVLAEGEKATLLKLYKIRLAPDPSNTMDRESKVFEQYFEYYLYAKGKALQKIRLKEKEIVKALGGEPLLSNYIAQHNLDLSSEADLIQFITKFNTNFL